MSILISAQLAYPGLGLLVAGESMGLLVPGETALLVTAVLAHQGRLEIGVVVGVAALTAIVGYLLGRAGPRSLLAGRSRRGSAPSPSARARGGAVRSPRRPGRVPRPMGRRRTPAGGMARRDESHAVAQLPALDALGGIAWSASIGLGGYALGAAAGRLLSAGAAVAIAALVASTALLGFVRHRRSRLHGREPARPPIA